MMTASKPMKYVVSLLSGALFAVGLVISGMTQPGKVVGFLDFFGAWDPSLAFVMGGAVVVNLILFKLTVKRDAPLFGSKFRIPTRSDINWKLIAGGAVFGAGWGLAGYCPGPALASVGTGGANILVFVGAMIGGMYLYKWFDSAVLSKSGAKGGAKDDAKQAESPLPDKVTLSTD